MRVIRWHCATLIALMIVLHLRRSASLNENRADSISDKRSVLSRPSAIIVAILENVGLAVLLRIAAWRRRLSSSAFGL